MQQKNKGGSSTSLTQSFYPHGLSINGKTNLTMKLLMLPIRKFQQDISGEQFSNEVVQDQKCKKIQIGRLNDLFKTMENGPINIKGKDWDTGHLDSFLSTSPFGKPSIQPYTPQLNLTKPKSTTEDRFHKVGSIYFPSNFYSTYSCFNHLVTQKNAEFKSTMSSSYLNPSELQNKKLNFQQTKSSEGHLIPSQLQLKQMKALKEEEQNRQNTKSKFFALNKQNRILKNGYKSGILQVDDPENKDTMLYKEEHQKYNKKQNSLQKIQNYKRKITENYLKTHESINVINKNYKPLDKNCAVPYNLELFWKKRGKIPQEIQSHINPLNETKNRIFGSFQPKIKQSRKGLLQYQNDRGKHFDITLNIDEKEKYCQDAFLNYYRD